MAEEKSNATARAERHSRRTNIEKRMTATKNKITKPSRASDHHRRLKSSRVDLPARLQLNKLKFKSHFEFQENKDKQDKILDTSVTKDKDPPPGFSFVPVGHPELTKKCKDISREQGHMIFIVSDTDDDLQSLSHHVNRVGYHFRSADVEDALNLLGGVDGAMGSRTFLMQDNDKVPETQAEINKQADDALRDLFPRIPHYDREQIILQSFQKGGIGNARKGAPVVGLADGLPLARRVQLAANAHIRHVHTRYDELLQETDWWNARRLVEPICLDIIMKWRGDEETGRDQLDEILREVVVIPDSDDEGEDSDKSTEMESALSSGDEVQFLREVTRAPSRQHSPLHDPTLYNHMPVAHRAQGAGKAPHPDDPDYQEKKKQLRLQNNHQSKRQKNRQFWREKKQDKQRRGRYEEAKKRNGPGSQQYAASARLNYDENANNMQQESVPQPSYQPHPMARQPLQEARYGQPNNNSNYHQSTPQEVGSSISYPFDLSPMDNRLPVTYQDISAPQGPPPFQQPIRRPEFIPHPHQRIVSSHQGLPILTHEEHLRRQQQRQQGQTLPPRPRSPTVMPSIENIDLTDSPLPVRRNSPGLINGPPRCVQTAPQPQYVDYEYDHWTPAPASSRPLPQQTEMVFVRDHEGKRRRVMEEPRRHPEPEYVVVHRPIQDAYTFPVSRAPAPMPVSHPEMRFVNEAYDPHHPILVSSSPLTENTPPMAPQPRPISLRGGEQRGSQFDDIFRKGDEQHARALRGESKRPRPISNGIAYEHSALEPAMHRVEPRVPNFGIPAAPARASTMQYPLQESRRPGAQPRPVERLPVYNRYGEQVHVPDHELDRILHQAEVREPVYVRGPPIHPSRQQGYDGWEPQPIQREYVDDGHPGSRLVEARPRHDYRNLHNRPAAPIRTQSDIEGHQPRYRERTVVPQHAPPPPRKVQYEQQPIRRAPPNGPIQVIGADGQRYMQLLGGNGQPGELLPIKTEREHREASMMPQSKPESRPQSRMYGEGMERQPRMVGGYDVAYEEQQGRQGGQRAYGRGDVIVLDD